MFLKERPGPLVIRSRGGYVDITNGPRNYALCDGYPCNERPQIYFVIVAVGEYNRLLKQFFKLFYKV